MIVALWNVKLIKQIGMFQKQKSFKSDQTIEIETLKAKLCACIPKGETPEETGFNIFSYAYK